MSNCAPPTPGGSLLATNLPHGPDRPQVGPQMWRKPCSRTMGGEGLEPPTPSV